MCKRYTEIKQHEILNSMEEKCDEAWYGRYPVERAPTPEVFELCMHLGDVWHEKLIFLKKNSVATVFQIFRLHHIIVL